MGKEKGTSTYTSPGAKNVAADGIVLGTAARQSKQKSDAVYDKNFPA